MTDPTTDLALRARAGDPAAQAAFVRATQAEVWRFAAALVDPGSADGVVPLFDRLAAAAGRRSVPPLGAGQYVYVRSRVA